MWIEIGLGLVGIILLIWFANRRPSGLPPGKWGLPLIGYVPLSGKYIDDMLMDMHREYGDIYIWRFGTRLQVYIHDYNILKQVFGSTDYIDRPDMEMFKGFEEVAMGISGSNGGLWHANRKFFLRQLKDLGMGKSHLVDAIQDQAMIFLEALKKNEGKEGPIPEALNFVIINIIWKMTANQSFDIDSEKHKYLQKMMAEAMLESNALAMSDMMPWTRKYLPGFIFRKVFKEDRVREIIDKFSEFFYEMIDDHKAKLDEDDPKDLIDAYLIEMNQCKNDNKEMEMGSIRSDADLKMILFDALFAGSDTTFQSLRWVFLYLAAYPDKQHKLQQEIDEVLPNRKFFTLDEKPRLPYTEAVINEVMRISCLASIGVPHAANKDTILAGYRIPKGAILTSMAASMHHDPRYWDKPEQFLPERWLSPEGKFVMAKAGYIPFGTGKRTCPGESLARMEVWVFTTSFFQTFSISPPDGKEIDLLPNYEMMMTHHPRQQDVIWTSRVQSSEISS